MLGDADPLRAQAAAHDRPLAGALGAVEHRDRGQLEARQQVDAGVDPTLTKLTDMFFTRARDGAAPFPNKAYSTFCNEP